MSLLLDWRLALVAAFVAYSCSLRAFVSPAPSAFGSKPLKVLILTAHPDDEAMFFAPAVTQLARRGASIEAVCVSNGNATGLGVTRELELLSSYAKLGVTREGVHLLQHPQLQDSMTALWRPQVIAEALQPWIESHPRPDVLLTFDERGVSGHSNHIALRAAVCDLPLRQAARYALRTAPLHLKFTSTLSLVMHTPRASASLDTWTFRNDFAGWKTALSAMREHKSQLIWFRWLYVLFSRHMWLSVFERIECTS